MQMPNDWMAPAERQRQVRFEGYRICYICVSEEFVRCELPRPFPEAPERRRKRAEMPNLLRSSEHRFGCRHHLRRDPHVPEDLNERSLERCDNSEGDVVLEGSRRKIEQHSLCTAKLRGCGHRGYPDC